MDHQGQGLDPARPETALLSPDEFKHEYERLYGIVSDKLLGKPDVISRALFCLLSEGHLLIEGPPGLGKTVLAKALAKAIGGTQARIPFTYDLLPGDVTGSMIWDPRSGRFSFHKGPVFHHVVLADEINRAAPKAQSALLEVMEERRHTADGKARKVPQPFFVIATQNPIEMHGTYPLPEALFDRFAMKVTIDRPGEAAELQMVREDRRSVRMPDDDTVGDGTDGDEVDPEAAASQQALRAMIETAARCVRVCDPVLAYCVALAAATRGRPGVVGVSPRATLALVAAARVRALTRDDPHAIPTDVPYVTPDDVQWLVPEVFTHRIVVGAAARRERVTAEVLVEQALATVPVPEL